MIFKCPTCRRRYSLETENCERCGTDLTDLVALEKQRQQLITYAFQALKIDPAKAKECLLKAEQISSGDMEVKRGLALASLLLGDFEEAVNHNLRVVKI